MTSLSSRFERRTCSIAVSIRKGREDISDVEAFYLYDTFLYRLVLTWILDVLPCNW